MGKFLHTQLKFHQPGSDISLSQPRPSERGKIELAGACPTTNFLVLSDETAHWISGAERETYPTLLRGQKDIDKEGCSLEIKIAGIIRKQSLL